MTAAGDPPGAPSPLVAETIATLKAMAQPCLRIAPGGDGRSRFGGAPEMAGVWPRFEGRPLSFVAQLNLSDLRAAGGPGWLPEDGRLLFFYDLVHGSWGLHAEDAGSAVVLHETGAPIAATEPDDLPDEARFPVYPVAFVAGDSYPSADRVEIDWAVLDATSVDALQTALADLAPAAPAHQIGGFPYPVQSDEMEGECEDVAQRLGQRVSAPADWRLLLQLDTDEAADMMWCDVGSLYFWIRERDARVGDFSRVWMILQSN